MIARAANRVIASSTQGMFRRVPETRSKKPTSRKRKSKLLFIAVRRLVEREVQLQNVHSGVAENAEITPIGVLLDEFADFVFAQARAFSHPRELQLGIAQADLGSSPLPDAVTASAGTGSVSFKPFSARYAAMRSLIALSSFWDVGPRLLPPELVAS